MTVFRIFKRKPKQETFRGITFDPSTLFLEPVGFDLNGNSLDAIRFAHKPASLTDAEERAQEILRSSPSIYYMRLRAQTNDSAVTIAIVWGNE